MQVRGLARGIGLAIGLALAVPSAAQAASFTVTRFDDPAPGACLSGDCSLREAVIAANSNGNPGETDFITLGAGTYALTISTGTDDSAAITDLDINQPLTMTGAGASSTTIDASGITVEDQAIQAGPNASTIEIVGVTITGGDSAGIENASGVDLTLTRSAVVGNSDGGNCCGGGIDASSGNSLTLTDTTVSGNTGGDGAGIWLAIGTTITNSTISGNTSTSEGGGFLNESGTTNFVNSTVAFNTAPAGLGGGIVNYGTTNLRNTIVSNNTGDNCEATFEPATSLGNNLEDANTCGLNQVGDKPNTNPLLGPLASNGGETQTHALGGASPAIDTAGGCPATDQRGVPRPQKAACDMGAYELVTSRTVPSLPDCSPSGDITLRMNVPGETPESFHYKLNDGPTQTVPTNDDTATVSFPEGRHKLEYWSETVQGGEEPQADHQIGTALIDKTDPSLAVASDQGKSLYVIKREASVTVAAADALSGLTINPSAQNEPVRTSSRGQKMVEWTAQDLCENKTTQRFEYTVLGPGLGVRAVIEPLDEDVRVKLPAGDAARASQKGTEFEALRQPREIPIGSTIDARAGSARITSSQSATEGEIQDGAFVAGVFQVLQSRKESSKGLTTLRLKGSSFKNCQAEASAGGAGAALLSRRAIRRLRGNATGRFRTGGRHSAATVRGTKWTVTDRCDGTLTTVKRGTVAVRDFRLKQTILLTRGKSYLAEAQVSPPKLGKTVNASVVKGKVFIKLPAGSASARVSQKGTAFEPLRARRSIPVRSILDTRRGTVKISSARNRTGKTQSGRFAAGVFQVLQSRKKAQKGLTELRLKGSAAGFKSCRTGKRSAAGETTAAASLTRRAIRRLRARARGRYRTRGRHSAATVRGTVWTMTDRCDGTLTKVSRGTVAVRDFRRKKTIVLKRGKSYLARAPR